MVRIIAVVAIFVIIGIAHGVVLAKNRYWKELITALALLLVGCIVAILIASDVELPRVSTLITQNIKSLLGQ